MSKFPSLQNIAQAILKTITRFPLETITAVIGTILSIILNEKSYNDPNRELYQKALMSCSLCFVLFLSVSLFFLASKKNNILRFLTSLVLGSLIVAFIFSFHQYITNLEIQQFIVLNIALHLLVSFAGFIPKRYDQDEFWEFNKQLFLRILTAGLYSIVLYSGLALAILAVDNLFNVEFNRNIYLYLFFIIVGIFNTIFFLSGIPETNNKEVPLTLNYPKGLKTFTQFILLPLISVYLVILICYEAKILATLSLPVGWVSYLVLIFALFGILSFLLVLPIAKETENLWIRTFNRWFYYLLIPLLGLLFWAILYRINLYGFTHDRYYVLLLAILLSIIVGYFLIQKYPKIKFIPICLCLGGLFSLVGPQSANAVSKNSQLSRFEEYVERSQKEKLTFEEEKDLSSIVDFVKKNHDAKILLPVTNNKLDILIKSQTNPSSFSIMEALGLQYRSPYDSKKETSDNFYYNYSTNEIQNIHGYDITFVYYQGLDLTCTDCIKINNVNYSILSIEKNYGLDLMINQDSIPLRISDFINTNYLLFKNRVNNTISQRIESPKYSILINYLNASGSRKEKKLTLNNYQIRVTIKIKN
ncbi:DUF4153 domain-containing protein [Flavobacterium branchiarum]|uniref:DUF4153 domain-containing protein n=1 Tax=Flavobacterium branchiarum TaxID=1114870 RepID=A0ABV5FQV2_9FLAO|nr:DUF4153 domain-containing protein [Flavobacterium branchiarum]MDN3671712.1 DUF4153 domain-containing protein [Flavobacterium branchiarum]